MLKYSSEIESHVGCVINLLKKRGELSEGVDYLGILITDTNLCYFLHRCINGYLANKPRILVTHQIQYLTDADQILVMSEVRRLFSNFLGTAKSHLI